MYDIEFYSACESDMLLIDRFHGTERVRREGSAPYVRGRAHPLSTLREKRTFSTSSFEPSGTLKTQTNEINVRFSANF